MLAAAACDADDLERWQREGETPAAVDLAIQVSSIQRLLSLPALFSGRDLAVRFQWTSKAASQYLYLWKKRGLVQPLGGHSDVFANTLVQPQPDWESALRLTMPSAVVVRIEALRRGG